MPQSLRSPLFGVLVALIVVIGFSVTTMQTASSQIPTEPPTAPGSGEVTSERLGGDSRFDTSVQISQEAFPEGSLSVYLARADEFADALSGSSLTTDGPILLVPQCGDIPQVVLDEIERLAPQRVVALGGVDAVCEQVLQDATEAARGADATESPSPSETATSFPTASPSPSATECEPGPLPPVIGEDCPTEGPTPTPTPTTPAARS
jgi:hypothetical protein